MFETLFTCPSALRRHREGPLASERAAYLSELAAQRMAQGTILRRARYSLCLAVELQRWPPDYCFYKDEVEELATAWATGRHDSGRASSPRWPKEHFWFTAMDFLRSVGRLRPAQAPKAGRYDAELADFIAAQRQDRWQSVTTCGSARWQITRFLGYLEQRGIALSDVAATDIDAFYEHMAQRWGRSSLRTSAKFLRTWFGYCETRGWARSGLADAIILLLSVYGLRSGEVRRLRLDDIDWSQDRIRFIRSKSGRQETAPLEPRVGNAIARYLRDGRPKTDGRIVFLTLRAPYRPLSAGGLYGVVHRHLSKVASPKKGRGPHGLRHACARHLVESGRSFKEVGDHLGHRSPDATSVYAKVDLTSLRKVAFDDLGGLT